VHYAVAGNCAVPVVVCLFWVLCGCACEATPAAKKLRE
jgi:hypothetical protein